MGSQPVETNNAEDHGLAPVPRLRWLMLGWPLAAGVVNYMDRMGISVAAPALMHDFGYSRTQIGLLGTVFSWSYAVSQLPAGWLVDRFGARRAYAMAIACWSVATALMGYGVRLWQFLLFRMLLGIAEAPNGPASAKMTGDWFPAEERGQASAIWDSGSKWGPAIAPPILTTILLAWGWRWIFFLLGLVGVLLAAAMYTFYRHPDAHPRLGAVERKHIQKPHVDGEKSVHPWRELFTFKQVWGLMAGYFCIIWVWNIFIVFLPLYLQEARGVSIGGSGVLAGIPYLGAAVMGIAGGSLMTTATKKRKGSVLQVKLRFITFCSVGAGAMVCAIPFVSSVAITIAVVTLALGFIATMTAAAWAIPSDIVGPAQVGSVGAIQNFGGYFGGAFAPLLTGMIADATGSYAISFFAAGLIAASAAVMYRTFVREPLDAKQRA